MQAAATPPLPPPRHRVYTAVDPRCEWRNTEEADTLVVDVSGKATLPRRRDRTSHQRACRLLRLTNNKRSLFHPFRVQEGGAEGRVQRPAEEAEGHRRAPARRRAQAEGHRGAPGRRRPVGALPQGGPGAQELRRRHHPGQARHREGPALRRPAQAQGIVVVVVQGQAEGASPCGARTLS
jgi:hypothetical protein